MSSGSVYSRRGHWWIKYRWRGREVRQSVARLLDMAPDQVTEKTARRVLESRLREVSAGRYVGPKEERLTVGELLDMYVADLKLRNTKAPGVVERRCRPIKVALGHLRVVDVTTAILKGYIAERLALGFAPGTVSMGEIAALRAAFRMGRREQRVRDLPHFPMLKVRNARQGFLEPEQFEAIAARMPQLHRDVATFAYLTVRRIDDEVLQLPWAWVDLRAGEIRWPDTKNDEAVALPIMDQVREILERRRRARLIGSRLSEWVFHAGRPTPLSPSGFREQLVRAAAAVGIRGLMPHDLRRSGLRNLMRSKGVTETVAMSISGHRSRSVFDRYNITSLEDQRRALSAVEQYLQTRTKPGTKADTGDRGPEQKP
jgi:integrase